jgi:EmrB/QacA subfamily drug resistance transporter
LEHPPVHPVAAASEPLGDERRWLGLWVITAAIFISAVDATIVNVALPDIASALDAGLNELQWVIDAFLVALAGLLLVGGGVADRFGRRAVFLGGFAAFAAASVLAAIAGTPEQLIAARVVMGASIAFLLPPALSLISVIFAPEERPRAIAIWAAVAGLGFGLGPIAGGALIDLLGWRWVFLVNVPFAIVAVPAGRRLLPESRRPGAPPLDFVGAALSIVALGGIVFALIEGQGRGWGHPAVLLAIVAGLGAAGAFVRVELRRRDPLFDVRVVLRPAVRAGAVAMLAMYGSFMGMLFLVPQYLQQSQGRSAFVAGLLLAPVGFGLSATSPLGPRLTARLGPHRGLAAGLLAIAASFIPLVVLSPGATPLLAGLGALLYGLGLGLTIGPATRLIIDDLGAEKAGDAAAVNQLGRQVGGALGVALVGTVFAAIAQDASATAALRGGLALCAAFLVAAAVVAARPPAPAARRP